MWRQLHSLPGLIGLALLLALALSGAMLSIYPALNSLAPEAQQPAGLSVGQLVARVAPGLPDMDTLTRSPSGAITASYFDRSGAPQKAYVDTATGELLQPVPRGPSFYNSLKDFHRALFMGENGKIVAGIGAALMLLMSVSGIVLLISRMGGIGRVLDRPRGNWSQRTHTVVTRLAILPLAFSALTGGYIVLVEFEVVPVEAAASLTFPQSTQGLPAVPPGSLQGLRDIPLDTLVSLRFPIPGDTTDVFTAETDAGITVIDQFNGAVLEQVPATTSQKIYRWLYALHTGEGMAWFGLILGLAALTVPLLGLTGALVWWKRTRGNRHRIAGNHPAATAEIVVLVGSEGGATWGFARSLHRDMTQAGLRVHVAAMNGFGPRFPRARQYLFLASTYGDGHAPQSAARFRSILADLGQVPDAPYSVLGFGDRAFPHFCQYAKDLDLDLEDHGWSRNLPTSFINRQSTQAFATWGTELGAALGVPLSLSHQVELPPTRRLTLIDRTLYGEQVQAPTAVLRFRLDVASRAGLIDRLLGRDGKRPRFAAGDLLGVLPPGSRVPRYYSVSSANSDSEVEICVRKQTGGECSSFLHALEIADEIDAFVRPNPDFQMVRGRNPVIMVSAGTGIAPFIGMIRMNRKRREIHFFWGGRDPDSDFLFQDEIARGLKDHRIARSITAFSRTQTGGYVQDRVRQDAGRLATLLRSGAAVMVCGGDGMAQAVLAEFEAILRPLNLSVPHLKSRGLYLEDIF